MRKAGMLMPVSALPDRHGCGCFGKNAYHFADLIRQCGISIWQILPLNPLGYGNSPYQPYSSYAMDEIYISLDLLEEQGLIERAPSFHRNADIVTYETVRNFKDRYLREAYANFQKDAAYEAFAGQTWVQNYAVFMTLKKKNGMRCWTEWPKEDKDILNRGKEALKPYAEEIDYRIFLQYILFTQWNDLKKYANDRGIEIVGDLPFYVGLDSADVFANRKCFLLDKDGEPDFIAGVPPDYFAKYGQRWGNPIYDWDYMEKTKFQFWIERISYSKKMFDQVRVDHFRAFDTYWKIPSSCPTAIEGEWIEAPGYALFDELFRQDPDIRIIAEDLGDLRDEVLVLRDHYKFRGMRVIQFSFNAAGMPADREHLIVYTGTHDNEPILSWYLSLPNRERRAMRRYLWNHGYRKHSFSKDIIDYSLDSNADIVIIPIADWIHAGHEARLNTPGSVGSPNWEWRMKDFSRLNSYLDEITEAVAGSGRRNDL